MARCFLREKSFSSLYLYTNLQMQSASVAVSILSDIDTANVKERKGLRAALNLYKCVRFRSSLSLSLSPSMESSPSCVRHITLSDRRRRFIAAVGEIGD